MTFVHGFWMVFCLKYYQHIETTGRRQVTDGQTDTCVFVSNCILQSGSSLLRDKTLGGSYPVMSNSHTALAKCHDSKDGQSLGRLAGILVMRMDMVRREITVWEGRNSTHSAPQSEKSISDTLHGLMLEIAYNRITRAIFQYVY